MTLRNADNTSILTSGRDTIHSPTVWAISLNDCATKLQRKMIAIALKSLNFVCNKNQFEM